MSTNDQYIKDEREENEGIVHLPTVKQNFGLTKVQFEEMIDQLKGGNEALFERIFLSHFKNAEII